MSEGKSKKKKWLKRFGAGAFLFFTIKGIAWLVFFFFFAKSCAIF